MSTIILASYLYHCILTSQHRYKKYDKNRHSVEKKNLFLNMLVIAKMPHIMSFQIQYSTCKSAKSSSPADAVCTCRTPLHVILQLGSLSKKSFSEPWILYICRISKSCTKVRMNAWQNERAKDWRNIELFLIICREFSLIGLALIAVGTGGIKPCVSSFGGNKVYNLSFIQF